MIWSNNLQKKNNAEMESFILKNILKKIFLD